MQIAHGLLLLSLIDIVAAASDVDGDETYLEYRRKIGEFVVENRVPSKPELDSLRATGDKLLFDYTNNEEASASRFEDPATHEAPAGLKSDVLRTSSAPQPAGAGITAPGALRDPFAIENQRNESRTTQAEQRQASHDAETGVAYEEGAAATTPTKQSRPAEQGENSTQPAMNSPVAGEGKEVGDDEQTGNDANDGDDEEPDFEGTKVADLKSWLDEKIAEGDEDAKYETDANKPRLIELAKKAYAKSQANKGNENDTGDAS